jgi:3-deoxy-manno-octulosonate cytidylyltransferase (CMP-KDO synthetase)
MIQWVYERAGETLPALVVATDDQRIRKVVEGFGGDVLMTSSRHRTGTERCAEALNLYQQKSAGVFSHVINIQGDEPLLRPGHLEALMNCFTNEETQIATLIQPHDHSRDLADPNLVKVTVDRSQKALYFSRSPIPFIKTQSDGPDQIPTCFTHIGLYAFRSEILMQLVTLPATPLEQSESLEQLRWMEHGYSIQTAITHQTSLGVDTPEDLERIRRMI